MLSPAHKRKLAIFFTIGLILFVWLNWFPPGGIGEEISIESETGLLRPEAAEPALTFIKDRVGTGDWVAFVSFDQYADAIGYFTKMKQTKLYEDSWSSDVPIDYYRVEVREQQADERYEVLVKQADGTVFGWEHIVKAQSSEEHAGNAPLTTADVEKAEIALAELNYPLEQYQLDSETNRQVIVFRHKQFVEEASLSLKVTMDNSNVVSIAPVIELPDDFTSWKQSQDLKGAISSGISLLLWFGLALAAIIYAAVYRASMSFGRGIWLSLAFLIPYLMYNINMLPGYKLEAGSAGLILFTQGLTMLMAVSVYLCLVAGDGLWRRMGHELWTPHRHASFSSEVMQSVGLGYVYCVIIMALQSLLFVIGAELFDVWFGVDPLMSTNNLLWPGQYPLLAWSAAISEEAVYRIFAIAFFTVLIRPLWRWVSRWTSKPIFLHPLFYLIPAITIANLLWALGHTSYSIYPVYTRLVEVAVLGFVFSFIFLRYGLIAAIFAHATMDLVIMGLELLTMGSVYVAVGLFYMVMPLLVGLIIRLFGRRHEKPPAPSADGPIIL